MSLRSLIRILALGLALVLVTPLAWPVVGPLPALAGLALPLLAGSWLALAAGGPAITRWQLRYVLEESGTDLARLDETLRFLADRAGRITLAADVHGLYLEVGGAFDGYVEAQLPRALPGARLTRAVTANNNSSSGQARFLLLSGASSELLRWATEGAGRQVRFHLHRGPHVTVMAETDGETPPGTWLRLPALPPLARLWRRLPVWDELGLITGTALSSLLPATDGSAVYSSHSPVQSLTPPADYKSAESGRELGAMPDGRRLLLPYTLPLFTVGAPADFLARQVAHDLRDGRAVVVASPHRRVLEAVQREAGQGVACYWLDQENSRVSTHLAIVTAAEWLPSGAQVDDVVQATERFLSDLGLDARLPAVRSLTHALLRLLAASAQFTGHDLAFSDLYAVSQSTQVLRAFLDDLQELAGLDSRTSGCLKGLLQQLAGEAGYVQVVSVLTTLRGILAPLKTASLDALCRPPYIEAGRLLTGRSLLLVPLADADFPEHNRFVAVMLDLVITRALAQEVDAPRLALHLHDPQRYRPDAGRRWLDAVRQDGRLAVLIDRSDPEGYSLAAEEGRQGELFFRCSDRLAAALVAEWGLGCPISDLVELPAGTALARLPGAAATLKTGGNE